MTSAEARPVIDHFSPIARARRDFAEEEEAIGRCSIRPSSPRRQTIIPAGVELNVTPCCSTGSLPLQDLRDARARSARHVHGDFADLHSYTANISITRDALTRRIATVTHDR